MGRRTSSERMEYWRQQIELYEESGQTREEYSAAQGIKVYTLDYWRRKLSNKSTADTTISESWVPIQIIEEEDGIDLSVGKVRITVRPGFNRKLLSEVIGVLAV
jgi:hypothetical protein